MIAIWRGAMGVMGTMGGWGGWPVRITGRFNADPDSEPLQRRTYDDDGRA
jgi:hypothetical protein